MGNCKHCRHWAQPFHDENIPISFQYGTCEIGSSRDGRPDYISSTAVALDAEAQHYAELRTMAEFGCVQFVKK